MTKGREDCVFYVDEDAGEPTIFCEKSGHLSGRQFCATLCNSFEQTTSDTAVWTQPNALSTQEGGNHYKDMVIQPIEYCQKNKLGALESFIVKYASRHSKKNGAEDVRKIIHCAELLLELEYGEE